MGNEFIHTLHAQLQARYSIEALNMSTSEWVCRNTQLRGKPFTLTDYEFQRRILDDMHPDMYVVKLSQVGLSEISIRKMLAFLERNQGTTGLFTLPSQPMRDRLAKTRVKPLIDGSEVFNRERDRSATRTSLIYQLGESFALFSDCTEGSATSTPADILMVDELDLSDLSMVALFGSRLQNSPHKIRQRFSTPTHVSFGIDAGFGTTDQHEYLCRCPSCGRWNLPDFAREHVTIPGLPADIGCLSEIEDHHVPLLDLAGSYACCDHCRARLDLTDPAMREWVPKYPGRTLSRGYRVRPFCTDRLSIQYIVSELLTYKRNNYVRGWWNTVVGKPFTAGNERLNRADVEACLINPARPDLATGVDISVGIDSGIMCHVTLAAGADPHTSRVFAMEVVHSEKLVEYVKALASRYNIVTGGMDRHPQTVLASQVFQASGGKIWPIEYRGSRELNPVKDATGESITHFQCDRTTLLDRVATRVRGRNLQMSGYNIQKDVIITHLTNMVRDEKPEEPARWLKLSEDDHYFHALGMLLTSMQIAGYLSSSDDVESREVIRLVGVNTTPVPALFGRRSTLASSLLGW